MRKEGKFRMLNQIFCKKKKELSQQIDLSEDCQLREETSEVDDIITMFDSVAEPLTRNESENNSAVRKPNNDESEKAHLLEDTFCKSLPPIRTQSLPPITLGKSLLVNSQPLTHRNTSGHVVEHLAHRSQKSKSEHDLFDGKSKSQKGLGPAWKTETNQIMSHKAWMTGPSERLLNRLLHETSSPLDVLCSNQTPYIQRNDQGTRSKMPFYK